MTAINTSNMGRKPALWQAIYIVICLAFVFMALPTHAVVYNWNVATGNWSDTGNWHIAGVPGSADDARINNAGTATIANGSPVSVNSFIIGTAASEGGTLIMNDDLTFSAVSTVGSSGNGTLTQNGGTLDATSFQLFIGSGSGSSGSYTLNGGAFTSSSQIRIGDNGYGLVTVNSGTLSPGTTLIIGGNSATMVGRADFVQAGGAVSATQVNIGRGTNPTASTYSISGGTLTAPVIQLGVDGTAKGNFYQTGGTVSASTDIKVGLGANTTGLYEVSGGTLDTARLMLYAGGTFEVIGSAGIINLGGSGLSVMNAAAQIKFVLDNSAGHISTIQSEKTTQVRTGNLKVGLKGGVLLTGTNIFYLLEAPSLGVESWTSTPGYLWTVGTANDVNGGTRDAVSITLDTDYLRGTLDASIAKNHLVLSPSAQGYVALEGVAGNLLEIGLDFGENYDLDDLNLFKSGLTDAGINWTTGYGVYEVGLFLDPNVSGGNYFAWDLSDYGTLQLYGIANVIPEPSSLVLLTLAGLALMRRRRR